jgi:hypothetical protein
MGDACSPDQPCKYPGLQCSNGLCACGTDDSTLYKLCGEKSLCVPSDAPAPAPPAPAPPAPAPLAPSGTLPEGVKKPPETSTKYTGFCATDQLAAISKSCPKNYFAAALNGTFACSDDPAATFEPGAAYATYCFYAGA